MPSGHAYTKAMRTCKSCVGTDFCRYGVGDSIGLAQKIERTMKLNPDRSVTIEDEWTAKEHAVTARFQWLTRAKVTRTAAGLLLEQAGKALALDIKHPTSATVEIQDVSAPRGPKDSPNPGLSRIVLSVPTAAHATVILRLHAHLTSTLYCPL